MMKGNAVFQKQNDSGTTVLDLAAFADGIGISNQDIESIVWDRNRKMERVLTIENL